MSVLVTRLVIGLLGFSMVLLVWRRTDELADRPSAQPRPSPPGDRWDLSEPATIRGVIEEATKSRFGSDYRLRPLLREVAGERLRQRHRLALDDAAAAALLGPSAWAFLRSDRPVVRDFRAAGLPLARIAEIIEAVERL